MNNASILSYEIFSPQNEEYSAFDFPNLTGIQKSCKEPKDCKVTCYTFRESTDTEKLRKDLGTAISNLGHLTKDEFERSYNSKDEWVDNITFKNIINPFDKNKSRNQKLASVGLVAFYVSPFVLWPASILSKAGPLDSAAVYTTFGSIAGELSRRASLRRNKEEMKEMRTKFNDPHREFFCELKDVTPKIGVDTFYVEGAHDIVEFAKHHQLLDMKFKKQNVPLVTNFQRVNTELFREYETYASQHKV